MTVDVDQLPDIDYVRLARVAEHIITTRTASPGFVGRELHIGQTAAEIHLADLERNWGIVGRNSDQAIRRVLIHPNHVDHIVDAITKCRGIAPVHHPFARLAMPPLSAEDHILVQLVADGLLNRQIGHRMQIGEETVKTHLRRLFRVLNATDRTNMVYRAYLHGLFGDIPKAKGASSG